MKSYHLLVRAGFASLVCLVASCAYQANSEADGSVKNPHPPGSHAHFKSEPSYPKTHSVWKDDALFAETHPENSHIKICLNSQRGFLMNGEQVVIDYPICSGRKSHPTPAGTFYIIEKIVDKRSNRYGRIYGPEGELINSDADSQRDLVPEGGKFVGASMRYWMRLTHDGIGHHIGPVKRYPASHACIRGPSATMPLVYSKVEPGSRVVIE